MRWFKWRALAGVAVSVCAAAALPRTADAAADLEDYILITHIASLPNPGDNPTNFSGVAFNHDTGGLYIVEDHAAAAGADPAVVGKELHRIDPAVVRREAEAAGFVFDGETKVLANPADDHTLKVFDPALRGHTDRFVLRFRKPGKK